MKVFLLILILNAHSDIVGYLPGGAGDSVAACQAVAAKVVEQNKDQFPKDTKPLPLCIDTGLITGTGPDNQKL